MFENFDFSTMLPIFFAILSSPPVIAWVFSIFPGLKQFVALLPQPAFVALVKAKDPNAVITWGQTVAERRAELVGRKETLLAIIAGGAAKGSEEADLKAANAQLAKLPTGGILDWVKANPMILIAIAGIVAPLILGGGGCNKKPVAPPAKPAATKIAEPEVSVSHPQIGLLLASR